MYVQNLRPDRLDATNTFLFCFSQAMAVATRGDQAYLFMPQDKEPLAGTVWLDTELPALTQNPNVQTIYRVDPTSQAHSDSESEDEDSPCEKQ